MRTFLKGFRHRTVASELMFWLALVVMTTITIVGISYYFYTTKNIKSSLIEQATATEKEIVNILERQLFNIDNVAVRHTAEVFLASGRISGIRIVADVAGTNNILVDKPSHHASILPGKRLTLVKDVHKLGSVELWFSDNDIRYAQKQTVLIVFIIIAATLAVTAFAIYFILHFLLVKPLALLKQRIETLASGSFDGSLPSVPQQDLNPIMLAINNMANELSKKTSLLIDQKLKYQQIFNAPSDAIILHDATTGAILETNLAMLKMFGYPCSAAKKLTINDLSFGESPYSQKEAIAFVEKTVKEGEQLFEWRSKRKNGDIFWSEVALRSSKVKGETRVLSVIRDISDRKKIEDALEESEEKYRLLIENAQEAIIVSQEGKINLFNSKVLEISGYSAEEVQCMKIEDFIYPDDRSAFIGLMQKRLAGEEIPPLYSFRIIDKTGAIKWIEENSVLISREGEPAVLSIASDITKRKESEQALIDSATRYHTLFESAGDSIFILHNDTFIDCNKKTLELFNCSREDIIGQPPYIFSPEIQPDGSDSKEKAIEKINSADFDGKQQIFEWQHKKYDGTLFDAEVSLNSFAIGSETFLQAIVRDITQRKQAEQELIKKEQQQALILRSLPMAFYVANPFGTYGGTWVSEQIQNISGFPPEQFIINKNLWVERLHPDDRERTLSEFEKITEKGSISVEYRWQAADDSYFWINDEAVLIREENGEVKEIVGTWLDITERKEAEEQLRFSQEKFNTAFQFSPSGIMLYDVDQRRRVEVNNAYSKITGYSREELLASNFLELPLLSNLKEYETIRHFFQQQKSIRDYESRLRTKTGEERLVKFTADYLELRGINYALFTLDDITEKRKNEEALLMTQHTVDESFLPIVWMENDIIIYANKATCDLTGFSIDELLSGEFAFLDPNRSRESWEKYFPQLKQKKHLMVEEQIRTKDNSIIPILINASYLEYGDRELAVLLTQDLTEQKKLEADLRQAQKMEAIGTLAGGIAHDFNNILTALFGYTELAIMQAKDNPKLTKDLDEVRQAGRRARDLVKQILTFSRKTEQEKQPLQVSLVVKEALKLLRSSLPSTITFKQNIVSNSTVLADPTQIHQIIMNLSTNAYQAMKDQKGTLGISLQDIDINTKDTVLGFDLKPGKYLRLEISDTGCGMDKETSSKIFEPYFTTKQKGQGTGLGLAVVHGIVQSHSGKINVYSEPGEGTTFHVYLPRIPKKHSKSEKKAKEVPAQGHQEHIMFVDDEEKIVNLANEIFKEYGYRIDTYTNSSDALLAFENQPDKYDLVITDQTMPGMIGTEIAKKMMEIRSDIPIILCTGYSSTINRERILDMGIKEYVQKPVAMSSLVKTVKKILDRAN